MLVALATLILAFGGSILAYTYRHAVPRARERFRSCCDQLAPDRLRCRCGTGTFAAGLLADRWPAGTVVTGLALLSAVLLIMTLAGETRLGALLTLIAWGGPAFGIGPALQDRAAPDIPQIASSLAISALNLGIAAGALAGGRVVASAGIHAVTWIGGLVNSAAVLLALHSTFTVGTPLVRRPSPPTSRPTPSGRLARAPEHLAPCTPCAAHPCRAPTQNPEGERQ